MPGSFCRGWGTLALTVGLQVGNSLADHERNGFLLWVLLLEAVGTRAVSRVYGLSWAPGARCPCSHTHCCSETPNCWLGNGGRGGMGLGAVAGLFCVDFRKSSYLGSRWDGQALCLAL